MVRTKNEILAEANEEDTVLKSNNSEEFIEDSFIIGADNKISNFVDNIIHGYLI